MHFAVLPHAVEQIEHHLAIYRHGNLGPQVTAFGNLLQAAKMAAAGKRRRPDVALFEMDLETELFRLRRELLA